MKHISQFPNLELVLKKLTIINNMVEQIFKLKKDETLIGLTIITAIEDRTPANDIIHYIADMAKDNRQMIDSIIGNDLTQEIINI